MSDVEENVELLREAGAYENDAAVIEDALRTCCGRNLASGPNSPSGSTEPSASASTGQRRSRA